jgi:hypothetical protein
LPTPTDVLSAQRHQPIALSGACQPEKVFDWLLIDHSVFFKVNELIISK